MSTITNIAAGDLITNSRTDINTNFSNLNADKIETSVIDTDTALAANSDAKIPSQKAVKAYVDTLGNVNASTTSRGIVEEATVAEINTGTAAGGTGARLFINPSSTVSTSAGSGDAGKVPRLGATGVLDTTFLSGVGKIATSGAAANVTNTVTETNVFSVSVPANTLGTSSAVRAVIFVSNFNYDDTNSTLTIRAKYGTTTLATLVIDPSAGDVTAAQAGRVTFNLIANAATNAQRGILEVDLYKNQLDPKSATQVAYTKAVNSGTAAEDSTGALNIIVSVQWGTATNDSDFNTVGYIIEKIF